MLKLLIVDDEPIIRGGIRGIIDWAQYGYTICGEAEDGPSAVTAILELKPDLVLLDLHLPGFSGLEVIKKIKSFEAEGKFNRGGVPRFLILSGYVEFEYAKEAINLDVNGYIVKPIDETVLIERISSIAQEIKKEDPQERRRIQFLEIMEGVYGEEDPIHFVRESVQAAFVLPEKTEPSDFADIIRKIKNFIPKNDANIFPYGEYLVILFEDTPETTVIHLLEKLHDYLQKSGNCPAITLGSYVRMNGHGSGIRQSCREAEELMRYVFFFRGKKYISSGINGSGGLDREPGEEALKLCSCIQVIDPQKIRSFFSELENKLSNSGREPGEIRQECLTLMIETRNNLVKKIPALRETLGTGREILDSIMRLRYLGDIIDAMTEASLSISEGLPLLSADSGFQRIISYVKNNYSEDLRLETLGQLFNYNSAYLGKRFKEYTGKSFHTYLDMLRIDAAKELLGNTAMKVYDISAAVGYANTDYFYSKFKKYAGESPLVYRRRPPDTEFIGEK
jgi:two-component system response regulator YesN